MGIVEECDVEILGDVHIERVPPVLGLLVQRHSNTILKTHHVFGFPLLLTAYRLTYRGNRVGGTGYSVGAVVSEEGDEEECHVI